MLTNKKIIMQQIDKYPYRYKNNDFTVRNISPQVYRYVGKTHKSIQELYQIFTFDFTE